MSKIIKKLTYKVINNESVAYSAARSAAESAAFAARSAAESAAFAARSAAESIEDQQCKTLLKILRRSR